MLELRAPSRNDVFPGHLCRRQVCLRADRPQAHLHHDSKGPARQQKPVDPQVHTLTFCANCMASVSAEVAGRNRVHTCTHGGTSTDQPCGLVTIKNSQTTSRETSLGRRCGSRRCHQWRIRLPVAQLFTAQLVQLVGRSLHVSVTFTTALCWNACRLIFGFDILDLDFWVQVDPVTASLSSKIYNCDSFSERCAFEGT